MRGSTVLGLMLFSSLSLAAGSTSVKGHFRKDGTYVQAHKRTNPDQLRRNNYGSEGNANPYTGKQGKQRNEFSNPPQYNDSHNSGQGKRLNQLYGNPTK
jgi:hypothetical protein